MKLTGLSAKLTSAFGLLSLFPLILTGIVSVYVFQMTQEQNVLTIESSVLRQKVEETKKFIEETSGLFEIKVGSLNSNSDNTGLIEEHNQEFLLQNLLRENKFIVEASLIDPTTGSTTAKFSRAQDSSLMELNNVQALTSFKTAKAGRVYLGEVYRTLDGPMMTISAPVLNSSGDVIMVISGEVSLLPLNSIFGATVLGNTGYLYIIDGKGNVVASSEKTLIGSNISKSTLATAVLSGSSNGALQTRAGLKSASVLAMSNPAGNPSWQMIAEWPADDAFAVVGSLRYEFILFCLAVVVTVLAAGWLVGRRILKPLATLRAGAKEYGEEKFDYQIKIDTGDEIEELGNIMNTMAADLKHHHEEIEESHKKIEDNLREIAKLKDDFIFVAAHELRSPVTVLQGYVAEILEDEKTIKMLVKKNPYFVDMVKGIEVSKERLSTLVDDLLDIARMGSGKFKIDIKPDVDLKTTVSTLMKSMTELGKPRGITVKFETKGKLPLLQIDPNRINEILTNLVSNSIKYNKDKGKVTITATFIKGRLYLTVADTGIGLSPDEQKHLFEKFWRSDDVRNLQGTGLGLFIVKHILEQMGGTISCESEKGKGTTFRFDIPA